MLDFHDDIQTEDHDDIRTETATPNPRFQCRHIRTDGHRCGSPSLRHEDFCYYHHTTRKPIPTAELEARQTRQARRAAFTLPRPEDRSAIQAAIGEIVLRLAANQLDPRRAGLLLYGLQIASLNLPPRQPAQDPADTVEEVVAHPEHGLIAPEQDFQTRVRKEKSLEQILMEDWARDDEREARQQREREQTANLPQTAACKPFILDDLNAAAELNVPPRPGAPFFAGFIGKGWGIERSSTVFPQARKKRHPERSPARTLRRTKSKDPEGLRPSLAPRTTQPRTLFYLPATSAPLTLLPALTASSPPPTSPPYSPALPLRFAPPPHPDPA